MGYIDNRNKNETNYEINSTKDVLINFSYKWPDIGLMVRVFVHDLGGLGSISGRVIPKTLKMVLDASLLNTQHYKERIKGKVEKS